MSEAKIRIDAATALEKLKRDIIPAVRQLKSFAMDSKNWLRVTEGEPSDEELFGKYSVKYGDIICTYIIEDHGQKGVFHVLTIQFTGDYLTLPKTVVMEIVDLFIGKETKGLVVVQQPAVQVSQLVGGSVARFEIFIATAPYEREKIILT